jgi:hypothetical protein
LFDTGSGTEQIRVLPSYLRPKMNSRHREPPLSGVAIQEASTVLPHWTASSLRSSQ